MTSPAAMPLETFLKDLLPLAQSEQWSEVHAQCLARLESQGDESATLYLQGVAAFARNNLAEAASAACRALNTPPQFAESADLLARAHGLAGDLNTALYFAKLAITLPPRADLQAFHPSSFPNFAEVLAGVEEDRLVNRAKVAIGEGRLDLADNFLRQHLAFFPDDENAMLLVAVCEALQGDHFSAADWLRGTLHRRPASANLASALGSELSSTGAFGDARVVHQRATALAPDDPIVHIRQIIDLADNPATSAQELNQITQQWGKHFASTTEGELEAAAERPAILNVGVVLADLPGTPAGSFFADVLSRANPAQFRFVGYGFGTLSEGANVEFQHGVSEWYDLSDLDAHTIGDMLRAESLDLIVDTAGSLSPLTLAALGGRCAPRQALWRNAPFDFGLPAIDGQFSDTTLDAATSPAPHNRLITLQHGTVLAQLPPADAALFETAERSRIIFGADVNLRQLTAETVAWWAELLLAVPDSMLVLRDKALSKPKAAERLTVLFGNCGVAHRVDLLSAADDATYWSQVDVALMPTRSAAPQQAVEILWGGIPVLAPELPDRSQRQLASLMRHAGLDELVAGSIPEFVRIGMEWAKDGDRRMNFRDSIRGRLSASPVFDAEARAQDLWQACNQLYR